MKPWAYLAIVVAVIAGLSTASHFIYSAGKQSVVTKLKDDRIVVLKDGKQIDENVLAADDSALLCMLTDCPK